jgi:hypothetical protein
MAITTFCITLINIISMAMAFFILKTKNPYFSVPTDTFVDIQVPLQIGLNVLLMGLFLFISLTLFSLTKKLSTEERAKAYFYRDWGLGFLGFFLCIVLFIIIPIVFKMAWSL